LSGVPLPEALGGRLDAIVGRAQGGQRLPSVSACVFEQGETVWSRVLGLADVATGTPATAAHAYRIGSITKTFTAVAILRLRDEGRLDLDAPVRSKLPEFPSGPTFRQALSHASGLQREPPGEIWESLTPPDREQLVAGLEDAERVLAPGVAFHYSNLVFALLGEVVARTGTSYETTLRERILDPLGLARTALRPATPVATPYFVHPHHDRVRRSVGPSGAAPLPSAVRSSPDVS
jgi:CubicO group peptidase (beta-lactamase class C family)